MRDIFYRVHRSINLYASLSVSRIYLSIQQLPIDLGFKIKTISNIKRSMRRFRRQEQVGRRPVVSRIPRLLKFRDFTSGLAAPEGDSGGKLRPGETVSLS